MSNDINIISGTSGNDNLNGSSGTDLIMGKSGDDTINGGAGNDFINSGPGNDTIDAGAGNDIVFAGAGNDTVYGGSGNDWISGGAGNDVLDGGSGNDIVDGGAGNDLLVYTLTDNIGFKDQYFGGSGTDTLQLNLTSTQYNQYLSEINAFQAFLTQGAHYKCFTSVFSFSFGLKVSEVEKLELSITNTNNAPTANAVSAAGLEDAASVAVTLSGSDSDGTIASFKLSSLPANGTLYLDSGLTMLAAVGSNYTASGNALTLYFKPSADFNGSTNFLYTATDNGGLESAQASAHVSIAAVNDAPLSADHTLTLLEDTTYTLQASDFNFSDPVEGNAFSSVVIHSLPAAGSLYHDGVAVTAGQIIPVAEINAGFLNFIPAENGNGDNYANFSFSVKDDGGTANGGVDTSTAHTMTFNVTPVNDAPIITSDGGGDTAVISIDENSTAVTTIQVFDVDSAAADRTYSLSGADASLFSLNTNTGELSFINAPDYERPLDVNHDNIYEVAVTVNDNGIPNLSDTQALAIKVLDIGIPLFTNNDDVVNLIITSLNPVSSMEYSSFYNALAGNDTVKLIVDGDATALGFVQPFNGGDGNDNITIADCSSMIVNGGGDNDTLTAAGFFTTNNTLNGDEGNDTLFIRGENADNNTLNGGEGIDSLQIQGSHSTNNTLNGDAGDDNFVIAGFKNINNTLNGGEGNDYLQIAAKFCTNNTLNGDEGNDYLQIAANFCTNNTLNGDAGDDNLVIGGFSNTNNTLNGGEGSDNLGIDGTTCTNNTLNGGEGSDKLGIDGANCTNNTLNGGAGNDLFSISLRSTLFYSFNNQINGGSGHDTIDVGGASHTQILYLDNSEVSVAGINDDTISNFISGNDGLYFKSGQFHGDTNGDGVFDLSAFGTTTSGGDATAADQYYVFNTTTHQLFYDADANGAGSGVLVATFVNSDNVAATDLHFI